MHPPTRRPPTINLIYKCNPRIAARQRSHDGKKARRLKKTIAHSHPLHPPLFVTPQFVQYLRHRIIPTVHPINFIN